MCNDALKHHDTAATHTSNAHTTSPSPTGVVIIDAARTPIGKFRGSLSDVNALTLATCSTRALLERHPRIHDFVDYVIVGQSLQAGNGQNIARQIALNSGLDHSVRAITMNEVCGSGMQAIIAGVEKITLGKANVVIAGGVESMSRAPYLCQYDKENDTYSEPQSALVHDGLTDAFSCEHMGLTAERVANEYHVSRKQQDEFALSSHHKAARAWQHHWFDSEIAPVVVGERVVSQDEGVRPDTSFEKLAKLRAAFQNDGSVTAGNASPLSDGASTLILASKAFAEEHNVPYMAIIRGSSEVGVDPAMMGISPIDAIRALFKQTGTSAADIDLFEINEAFAACSVVVAEQLGIPESIINVAGGALALGHPIGASGARIVTTLAHQLRRVKGRFGVASLCIGGGLGLAILLERVASNHDKAATTQQQPTQKIPGTTLEERQDWLSTQGLVDQSVIDVWKTSNHALGDDAANHLIENTASVFSLPVGIVPHMIINGKDYTIPLATEEPSVVAACCNAAKICNASGGFIASGSPSLARGQVVVQFQRESAQIGRLIRYVTEHDQELIALMNGEFPHMLEYTTGVQRISTRVLDEEDCWSVPYATFVSIDVLMDRGNAMGANMLNTVLEFLAQRLREQLASNVLFSIVSNYVPESVVHSYVRIPFEELVKPLPIANQAIKGERFERGKALAQRIAAASLVANSDPYRAATHNKGIMNGIEAFALAIGNDTRALSAGIHTYAALHAHDISHQRYAGLSHWLMDGDALMGVIEAPIMLASVGGATRVLPQAQANLRLVCGRNTAVSNAQEVSFVAASVGLAQNLAALKALVSEGIQRGHMGMQARSLAMSIGATDDEITWVAKALQQLGSNAMNQQAALELLAQYRRSHG